MSDIDNQGQGEIQDENSQGLDEKKEDVKINIEDIKKQITAEFDKKYKSEIAGLNKKVSELTTAKMSTEERAEYEKKQLQEELAAYKSLSIQATKKEALIAAGIDPGYSKFIHGDTEDDITNAVKDLAELLERDKGAAKKELLGSVTKRPESGSAGGGMSIAKFNTMNQNEKAEWTRRNPEDWERLREEMLKKK